MFKKYTPIENSYRTEFLDRIKGHDYWDKEYVVQEKAHGSNLSFWTNDGGNFFAAKRSENLDIDEKFYNHQLLLSENIDRFKSIWLSIKNDYPDTNQITIYGEVIGGGYPHKEVERVKDAIKVQKGIFYCPGNAFYAFDIQLNGEVYLDIDYINALFEKNKLLYAKTLLKGSLDDCLAYSNIFPSTIPAEFNLPPVDPNFCEGVVIKPVKSCRFNNGVRVVLKNKNERWSENLKKIKPIKQDAPVSEKVKLLQDAILGYVNENRLSNVLSKLGEVTKSDFGRIIGSLNKDVLQDFRKDYKEFETLDKKEQKLITKSFVNASANLIKNYFSV